LFHRIVPKPVGYSRRQHAEWVRSPLVSLTVRPLRYPYRWPNQDLAGARPQEKGIDVALALDFATMRAWHANVMRLPVAQQFWTPGTRLYEPGYRDFVKATVEAARAAGLYVILDLHASDRGIPDLDEHPEGQPMADVAHSIPFWRDVARMFRDDGGVIFQLYNEPHEISWDIWRNGGTVPAGPRYPGGPWADAFEAAGMQQLYDVVRAEGARNLVIINGMHWGYLLDGIPQYAIDGYNIMYATHPYDWPDKQPDVWQRDWGFLAATHPVIVTEFGAYDCSRLWYYDELVSFAEARGISWVAWAWWTPPPVSEEYTEAQREADICLFPALIRDWSGTPSPSGELIRAWLAQTAAAG
jgi:endoglucanase